MEQEKALLACRELLTRSMHDAEKVASGLNRLNSSLRGMQSRVPAFRAQIGPLESKLEATHQAHCLTDSATRAADHLLDRFESLARLQIEIESGDPEQDIGAYLLAVIRLEESLGFLQRNSPEAIRRLHRALKAYQFHRSGPCCCGEDGNGGENLGERLRRIAGEKLQGEFLRLLLQSPENPPTKKKKKKKKWKNEEFLPLQIPVVQKLRVILKRWKPIAGLEHCIGLYQQARIQKLEGLLPIAGVSLRNLEEKWSQSFGASIQVIFMGELNLCKKIFREEGDEDQVGEILAGIAEPTLDPLLGFGENAVGDSSVPPPQKLFRLLELFQALQSSAPEYTILFQGQGECSTRIRTRVRELHKLLVDSSCRILSEIKSQIKSPSRSNPPPAPPPDAGVHKLTRFISDFLTCLLSESYSGIMEQVLEIESSWRAGRAQTPARQNSKRLVEQAGEGIIRSLERALESQSKRYKEPVHRQLFLMNNLFWALKKVDQRLGSGWVKEQRRRLQELGFEYQKLGWGNSLALISRQQQELLLPTSASSAESAGEVVRGRLERFRAEVEEACGRHRGCVVADVELREATRLALIHSLVPAYRSYLQFYAPLLLMGKNGVKLGPAGDYVDTALTRLFESLTPTD